MAAVIGNNFIGNGKPETGTPLFCCKKRIENVVDNGRVNPATRISNGNADKGLVVV